jgi:hypothetical protein
MRPTLYKHNRFQFKNSKPFLSELPVYRRYGISISLVLNLLNKLNEFILCRSMVSAINLVMKLHEYIRKFEVNGKKNF